MVGFRLDTQDSTLQRNDDHQAQTVTKKQHLVGLQERQEKEDQPPRKGREKTLSHAPPYKRKNHPKPSMDVHTSSE